MTIFLFFHLLFIFNTFSFFIYIKTEKFLNFTEEEFKNNEYPYFSVRMGTQQEKERKDNPKLYS